jgi:hypothetical protein
MIERVKNAPLRRGRKEMLAHLRGDHLSPTQRIRAKCFECMGMYADAAMDCGIESCPLYPLMPYHRKS